MKSIQTYKNLFNEVCDRSGYNIKSILFDRSSIFLEIHCKQWIEQMIYMIKSKIDFLNSKELLKNETYSFSSINKQFSLVSNENAMNSFHMHNYTPSLSKSIVVSSINCYSLIFESRSLRIHFLIMKTTNLSFQAHSKRTTTKCIWMDILVDLTGMKKKTHLCICLIHVYHES